MAPRQRIHSTQQSENTTYEESPPVSASSSSDLTENGRPTTTTTRKPTTKTTTTTTTTYSTNAVGTKPTKASTLNRQKEADIARDWHDYFNLVALIPIIVTAALNYDFSSFLRLESLSVPYVGEHFWLNWSTTFAYFFLDLAWVAIVPICVKSPGVIIKHHIAAMLYLLAPVFFPDFRWFIGYILTVEVNTWFLILRRVVFKTTGKPPHPLVGQSVSAMFYLTWIIVRCVIFPGILVKFFQLAVERVTETGILLHVEMPFIVVHASLCLLNMKWTYDLFKPIVKRWLGTETKKIVVQNGL